MIQFATIAGRYVDGGFVARQAERWIDRNGTEYKRIQDMIIEFTSSCDRDEATEWMVYYMKKAFGFTVGQPIMDDIHKDLCLAKNRKEAAAMFLAAYDIYASLTREEEKR